MSYKNGGVTFLNMVSPLIAYIKHSAGTRNWNINKRFLQLYNYSSTVVIKIIRFAEIEYVYWVGAAQNHVQKWTSRSASLNFWILLRKRTQLFKKTSLYIHNLCVVRRAWTRCRARKLSSVFLLRDLNSRSWNPKKLKNKWGRVRH